MLFFFSEYLLGLSVVHSSLRNPLGLPVLALFSVSFFLYPSLSLAPGQHLTFTIGEQKYSIFLPSQGMSSLRCLCKVRDATQGQQKLLCSACKKSISRRMQLREMFADRRFQIWGFFSCELLMCPIACGSSIMFFFYASKNFNKFIKLILSDSIFSTMHVCRFGHV